MIPMPDAAFARLRARLPAYVKWSFWTAIVMGLVAHLYIFTNLLPNHDAVFHLFQCDYGTASGRWFLPTVLALDGSFQMSWLQGLLSLLALAGTVCITTSLLHIRQPLAIIITAALLTAFPTVAATFTYMFTADAYFFGLLLAACAAWVAARWPVWGLPAGALLLILSLAVYQSYFPVAAVLLVGTLLFDCLEGRLHFRRIVLRGLRMVATLGLGILVYMAAARLIAALSGGLSDYMGISSMGSFSLAELPSLLRQCVEAYRTIFLQNDSGWYFSVTRWLLVLAACATAVLLLTLIARRQVGLARGLLALVLVVLYPLAGSLIVIMVAGAEVHDLMIYGLVYLLVLPLGLASFAWDHASEMGGVHASVQSLVSWVILAALAFTGYNYIVADNKAYLKMDVSFSQIEAYSNRLVSAIQSTSGYTTDLTVVLVGAENSDPLLEVAPELSQIALTGALNMATYRTQYSYGYLLNRFCALPNTVALVGDLPESQRSATLAVANTMPAYPQEGSVQLAEGVLIVRLN